METEHQLESSIRFSQVEEVLRMSLSFKNLELHEFLSSDSNVQDVVDFLLDIGDFSLELRKKSKPNTRATAKLRCSEDRKIVLDFYNFCTFPSGKTLKEIKLEEVCLDSTKLSWYEMAYRFACMFDKLVFLLVQKYMISACTSSKLKRLLEEAVSNYLINRED